MENGNMRRWLLALPAAWLTVAVSGQRSGDVVAAGDCNAATEWVQSHAGKLPTTYAEIIRYPIGYRQRIQAALPMDVRRALWRTQREAYVTSGLLSRQQKAFLDSIGPSMDSIFFASEAARERLVASTTAAAMKALGRDLTHQIVFVLGPDETAMPATLPLALRVALRHRIAMPEINCTCHVVNGGGEPSPPDCSSPYLCNTASCTFSERGCGGYGIMACNGECKAAQ